MAKLRCLILSFFVVTLAGEIWVQEAQANVILKLMAANPSKTQKQKATIRAYLPKETKPEDVIEKGDLSVEYDTQQGSYLVIGEYELEPGEVVERDVELKDIWLIPTAEIESIRLEFIKLEGMLKNTEFADRVAFLKNSIESKLNQITESQKIAPTNPQRHISDYRENVKVLESAKADMILTRSLLSQVKPVPTVVIWRLIIAIIIFLGLMGASFYFIWHKQVRTITSDDTFFVPKEEQSSESAPERHEEEKDSKQADVDKILTEGQKEG